MALWEAIQTGGLPKFLFTMLDETGERSRSHGIPLGVLKAQSAAIGLPLRTACATWYEYEEVFIASLVEMAVLGVKASVFGDIDFEGNREWEEMVSTKARLRPYLPLWKKPREDLLDTFFSLGFEAVIIATNDEKLGNGFLGEILRPSLIEKFATLGIDLSGEAGEYHTLVTNGPIFSTELKITTSAPNLRSGYWFLETKTIL